MRGIMKLKHLNLKLIIIMSMVIPLTLTKMSGAQVEEIVVTAAKRAQTLQDVPIAVSVVGAETIENAHIVDLLDIQTSVPSLRITQLQASAQTNFLIRGFGNGANNPGISPSVGIFIDGVYRSRSASALSDLPTVERVEVLRGPQNTLFGKNASAGVISITTALPDSEFNGSGEITMGNYNTLIAKGTITGPLSDNTSYRFTFNTNNSDGFFTDLVDNTGINERNRWGVRAQILSDLTDDLTLRVIADYDTAGEECCAIVTISNGLALVNGFTNAGGTLIDPPRPYAREVYLSFDLDNNLTGKGISAQFDYTTPYDVTLTSITSYRTQEYASNTDGDFSNVSLVDSNKLDDKIKTFMQEFRLTSDYDGPFQWMAGTIYHKEEIDHFRDIIFGQHTNAFITNVIIQGVNQLFIKQQIIRDFVAELGLPLPPGNAAAAVLTAIYNDPTDPNYGFLSKTIDTLFDFIAGCGLDDPLATFGVYCPEQQQIRASWWAQGEGVTKEGFIMDNESYSFFGQVDYELTPDLTLTIGANYTDDSKKVASDVIIVDAFSSLNLDELVIDTYDFIEGYAGLTPRLTDAEQLTLLAALDSLTTKLGLSDEDETLDALTVAFSEGDISQLSDLQIFKPFNNYPNAEENGIFDSDGFSYAIRLAYDQGDYNLYASYSTGFKATSVNLSYDGRGTVNLPRSARPEKAINIELGIKTIRDWGYLNFTIFNQTIEDFQSNLFNGTALNLVNAGEVNHRGAEFDALYQPIEPVILTLAGTYIDPIYKSFKQGPCDISRFPPAADDCAKGVSVADYTGQRPAGVHKLSITATATVAYRVSDSIDGFIRTEYVYEDPVKVEENVPVSIATREVKTVNASVGFTDEDAGWKILFWGRNITDDEYLRSAFPFPIAPDSFLGFTSNPRTYGVTLQQKF